jgi:hypothetical protein
MPPLEAAALETMKMDIAERLKSAIISPPGGSMMRYGKTYKDVNDAGERMRNIATWDFRLVRQAIFAFIELASTREWTVSGKPGSVARTVELINSAATWDIETGYVQNNFEEYLRRRALDYVTLGRTAFATRNPQDPETFSFEYLDPVKLYWSREYPNRDRRQMMPPVTPDEKIWAYGYTGEATLKHREVHLAYPIPVGQSMNRYISPLMLVYSTAVLAWLLEQHDTTSLDGRKIRDIFIVDKGLFDPLIQAIDAMLKIYSGDTSARSALPIVEATQTINGPLQDRIAQLGLSKIPEAFDRKAFEHTFANDIAGAFGLALRHFWQDDSNTNRALEEVQESRQQSKGPLAFVRMEQRLINASPLMRIYSPLTKPSRFGFVEETDTSRMKDEATALGLYAKGLSDLKMALGNINLDPMIFLAKAQELGWLPRDVPVADMILPGKAPAPEGTDPSIATGSVSRPNAPTEVTKSWSPEDELEYGDIVMNSKGVILSSRERIFSVVKILKRDFEADDN